jgi:hypothetical protein
VPVSHHNVSKQANKQTSKRANEHRHHECGRTIASSPAT